ncbi:glutamate--tRNA ligase [Candidatus Woesearchaeota archaeon CG08_land_8_20_14_0_20_47_9]|nr:MAG: glutamate--tRNA ligase [Candidatus Woesearchaeota archaeon CG1_02_47_18]PIO03991.1 MAG: glutamate--tRNA ligase [Candidatus Woesearchaeota archaeon CG08_land_8_20_14_0_20_47_9]HII29941.1 glutamate--tRNA ligase [Candidatus Woesearchaeota archaeon]
MDKQTEQTIRHLALQNAVRFSGRAQRGAVIGKVLSEIPRLREEIKSVTRHVASIVAEVNSLPLEKQIAELRKNAPELLEKREHEKEELPELENAVHGKVVTRIAPYPSGPLHIGNVRPFTINDEYVKRYKGRLLLVIDDTIGSEEKTIAEDAYDLIPAGLKWLGIDFHEIIYKSDRLETYYGYAREIISKGQAYVCTCSAEKLRENRGNGIECACRKQSEEKNIFLWEGMLSGKFRAGEAVVRIKTDMHHPNPAFRDRVVLRISERPHPRVGNKYKVWPLLEFSWAIDDHLLGITHVIRGKDLMMETDMERFIWNLLAWEHPVVIHTGMVRLEGIRISKSKSRQEVESGKYFGWDDPRTWSLQSLEKRGILPEAVRAFSLQGRMSKNDVTLPINNLYAENRKLLDKQASRYFFIWDPVKIRIENTPAKEVRLRKHPDDAERGERVLHVNCEFYITRQDFESIEEGRLYRLMECLNFTRQGKELVFHSEDHETFRKKGGGIMHWLPAEEAVKVKMLLPDGTWHLGLAEKGIDCVKLGETVQFERFGFARLNNKAANREAEFWLGHG